MNSEELTQDLTQGQSEPKTEKSENFTITEICEIFGISRQTVYARMNYLQIKPTKRGNTGYIDAQQMAYLEALDKYYKEHNCFDGYPVPEKSGPWSENQELGGEPTSSTQSTGIEQAITQFQPVGIEQHSDRLVMEAVTAKVSEKELENIDKQAQILAASRYIVTQNLANYYASTGEFSIPEIAQMVQQQQERTQAEWEQTHKTSDPNYLTQLLIDRAKAKAKAKAAG